MQDRRYCHLRAALQAERGRYEAAAEMIGRAALIAPGNPSIQYNHGNVLRELNRLEEALASYDRAFAINPNDPYALSLATVGQVYHTELNSRRKLTPAAQLRWTSRGHASRPSASSEPASLLGPGDII